MYEESKETPPITHNAPTVASALLWIRQLIHQIEDPMKIFRENKILMSNRVSFLSLIISLEISTVYYHISWNVFF